MIDTNVLLTILLMVIFIVTVVLFVNRYARRAGATISTPFGKVVVDGENGETPAVGDVGGDVITGSVVGGGTVGKSIRQGDKDA